MVKLVIGIVEVWQHLIQRGKVDKLNWEINFGQAAGKL